MSGFYDLPTDPPEFVYHWLKRDDWFHNTLPATAYYLKRLGDSDPNAPTYLANLFKAEMEGCMGVERFPEVPEQPKEKYVASLKTALSLILK